MTFSHRRAKALVFLLALLLLIGMNGCARTPAGVTAAVTRELLVQITFRDLIDLNKHYFFAIDTTGDASQGPVPVVGPPWGNGWGAGRITYYVEVDNAQPGFFGLYSFAPGSNLLAPTYLGRPLAADPVQDTNTISFTLDLNALATPMGAPPTEINFNIIATDRIPLNPNDPGPKLVDALGPLGNNYVNVNVAADQIYRNADSVEPEQAGDVADPSIDIVDWQVEVRTL